MYINEVSQIEECRSAILKELRTLGVKCRPKKPKTISKNVKANGKVFKVPLVSLPSVVVNLKRGEEVKVPKLVYYLCSLILKNVEAEGIFRKEGSKNRQNQMKSILNNGGDIDEEAELDVIDVACLLKVFLRELPEPLIPWDYHDCFLQSSLLNGQKVQSILLCCLLLPTEHLNTLAYLMQFFDEIAKHSSSNKMQSNNIAICVGPNIFPIEEKLSSANTQSRISRVNEIVRVMIENSSLLGYVPKYILERLDSDTDIKAKKKKRRSTSLTRMFNGLKKIVGGKTEENHNIVTPDLLLTPVNNVITKKRRGQTNGLSNKKKKELLNKLPENVLLSTPFTPCRTPVSMDLSGTHEKHLKDSADLMKQKKSQWFSRSKSVKNLKNEELIFRDNANTKKALERRWSAISQPSNAKKGKKRNSFAATTSNRKENFNVNKREENSVEPDYIKVPKEEYEAIKSRVSAMERRISMEIESVQSLIKTDNENNTNEEVDNNIKNVQTVYEQTLVQSEQLSSTTDQLAKRLSRELKIRRSSEHKIIRSPSARKIGSMRRRSKEFEKNNSKVTRHQSWHVPPKDAIPRVNLKRGKPNTIQTGLPTSRLGNDVLESKEIKRSRSSSVGDNTVKNISCNLSGSSCDTWMSAEGFFATLHSSDESSSLSNRASLARLRSQNAGMVLAKAKLFDKLKDSDSSSSLVRSIPRAKMGSKIGSVRNVDSRLSYRVRNLKYEEKRLSKKSVSPRRRNGCLTQKHKLQMAKQFLDSSAEKNSNKENVPENFNSLERQTVLPLKDRNKVDNQIISSPKYSTPRNIPPHIKKPLNVRSPKRLCRTPVGAERSTPMRVLKRPIHNV